MLGQEAVPELYEQGYFGRPKGKGLELSLVEAPISSTDPGSRSFRMERSWTFRPFSRRHLLWKRALSFAMWSTRTCESAATMSSPVARTFASIRGEATRGKSPAEFYVLVISERMPLPLQEIIQPVRVAGQMRKKLMLAIVDEESDITFYEAREKAMSGLMAELEPGGMATLLEDRVVLWDAAASRGCMSMDFTASLWAERLQLSLVESAYLLEKGVIPLVDRSGKALEPGELRGQGDARSRATSI